MQTSWERPEVGRMKFMGSSGGFPAELGSLLPSQFFSPFSLLFLIILAHYSYLSSLLLASSSPIPLFYKNAPLSLLFEVDDPECGKYCVKINGRNTCVNCKKWVRDKKSCAAQNAIVAADNCRRFGAGKMDQKCWRKQVEKGEAVVARR